MQGAHPHEAATLASEADLLTSEIPTRSTFTTALAVKLDQADVAGSVARLDPDSALQALDQQDPRWQALKPSRQLDLAAGLRSASSARLGWAFIAAILLLLVTLNHHAFRRSRPGAAAPGSATDGADGAAKGHGGRPWLHVLLPALGLVLTIALALWTGYRFAITDASRAADEIHSQADSINATGYSVLDRQWATAQQDAYVAARTDRTKAVAAVGELAFSSQARSQILRAEEARWNASAEAILGLLPRLADELTPPVIVAARHLSPPPGAVRVDARRLDLLAAGATGRTARFEATSDAEEERALSSGDRVRSYGAMLAIIAVASYLFGACLTLSEDRWRRVLLILGIGALAFSFVWSIIVRSGLAPIDPADSSRMLDFGRYHALLKTADSPEKLAIARGDLARMIRTEPGFAQASRDLAEATLGAIGSQGSGFPASSDPTVLKTLEGSGRGVVDELFAARNDEPDDSEVLSALSLNEGLLGLRTHDRARLQIALAMANHGLSRYGSSQMLLADQGLARFGLGNEAAGAAAFRSLVRHLDKARYAPPSIREVWVANALTALDAVAHAIPRLGPRVEDLKGAIVQSLPVDVAAPPRDAGAVTEATVRPSPSGLELRARLPRGLNPANDAVVVQWYSVVGSQRFVMPSISGEVSIPPDGWLDDRRSLLVESGEPRCLAPGSYAAEIYIDGTLSADIPPTAFSSPPAAVPGAILGKGFDPATSSLLGVTACRLPGWTRVPRAGSNVALFADRPNGAEDPSGSGLVVVKLHVPASLRRRPMESLILRAAQAGVLRVPSLPGHPAAIERAPFLGRSDAQVYDFLQAGRETLVATDLDPRSGDLLVCLLFAPRGWTPLQRAVYLDVMASFVALPPQ
jgi:hypothetical protein